MSGVERWLPIAGYEGSYEVSDLGRVRSLDRIDSRGNSLTGKVLSPFSWNRRHLSVGLRAGGIQCKFYVHHLVLVAFVGPRPEGMEGCHWNDDGTDNRAANLRWDTRSGNKLDAVRNGIHHQARKTHCPQGHPYSGENLYVAPKRGNRQCRECHRSRRTMKQKEAA